VYKGERGERKEAPRDLEAEYMRVKTETGEEKGRYTNHPRPKKEAENNNKEKEEKRKKNVRMANRKKGGERKMASIVQVGTSLL